MNAPVDQSRHHHDLGPMERSFDKLRRARERKSGYDDEFVCHRQGNIQLNEMPRDGDFQFGAKNRSKRFLKIIQLFLASLFLIVVSLFHADCTGDTGDQQQFFNGHGNAMAYSGVHQTNVSHDNQSPAARPEPQSMEPEPAQDSLVMLSAQSVPFYASADESPFPAEFGRPNRSQTAPATKPPDQKTNNGPTNGRQANQLASQQLVNTSANKQKHSPSPMLNILKGNLRLELPLTLAQNFSQDGRQLPFNDSTIGDPIEIRHKFTFTVNGKELALEPPNSTKHSRNSTATDNQNPVSRPTETNHHQSGNHHHFVAAAKQKAPQVRHSSEPRLKTSDHHGTTKVNRLGEFASWSNPNQDYDSGFEVNNEQPPVSETVNSGVQDSVWPNFAKQQSASRSDARSSSEPNNRSAPSSAVLASAVTRHIGGSGDLDTLDNDESPSSSSSLSGPPLPPGARASYKAADSSMVVFERNQARKSEVNNENKVISDWPKATSATTTTSKAPAASPRTKSGSTRFSTLLSTGSSAKSNGLDAANVPIGRSAPRQSYQKQQKEHETRYWDANELPNGSLVLKPAAGKTRERTSGEASAPNSVNIKLSLYPRAPVYAKARYTSSIVMNSLTSHGLAGTNRSTSAVSGASRDFGGADTGDDSSKINSDQNNGSPNNRSPIGVQQPVEHVAGGSSLNTNGDTGGRRAARWLDKPSTNQLDRSPNLNRHSALPGDNNSGQAKIDHHHSSMVSNEFESDGRPDSIREYPTNFSAQLTEPKDLQHQNSSIRVQKMTINNNEVGSTKTKKRDASGVKVGHDKSSSRVSQRDLAHHLPPHLQPIHHHFQHKPQPIISVPFQLGALKHKDDQSSSTAADNQPASLIQTTTTLGSVIGANKSPIIASNTKSNGSFFSQALASGPSPRQLLINHIVARPDDRLSGAGGTIVRTGSIIPYPFGAAGPSQLQLRALVPAAMALLAQAHQNAADTKHLRASNQLRALLASQQLHNSLALGDGSLQSSNKLNQNLSGGAEQMVASPNQLGVAHLGPTTNGVGTSESISYNSIANLQDYSDYRPAGGPESQPSGGNDSQAQVAMQSVADGSQNLGGVGDEQQRGSYGDYVVQGQESANYYDPSSGMRSQAGAAGTSPSSANIVGDHVATNSRSSMSDVYMKPEQKSSSSEPPSAGGSLRSSLDPFEDMTGGLATSEYERDLADLDEEFNRHAGFRRPLVSDSIVSLSPERYEAQATRYNRRPAPSYDYSTGDYLTTAGSISSIIPRPYQRSPPPWSSASASPAATGYSDTSDIWADSSFDYSPLASLLSPSHYTYRWRPRYMAHHHHHHHAHPQQQRIAAYPSAGSTTYLAASASEQPPYNIIPSSYGASAMPTETVSFTISPLAAAAAAAAAALAAADKTRQQHNHAWTFALPRLASTITAGPAAPSAPGAVAASSPHATTIPAYALHRPAASPYLFSSMPIYTAIAPRPAAPLASSASGVPASILPYFHAAGGAAPAIIAYRPAGAAVLHSTAPLLTAASFAYPLRLPMAPTAAAHYPHLARPISSAAASGGAPSRTNGATGAMRPFYSDLQFAESKSKSTNPAASSSDSSSKGATKGTTSLTAMARNLTKKMFGSASQIRPQHVAPPATFDVMAPLQQNSSLSGGGNSSPFTT